MTIFRTKEKHMKISRHPFAIAITVALLIGTTLSLNVQKTSATEAGPNGINIGLDFSWNDAANPSGHSASFLETDGITANNCSGGTMTAVTKTCNFVFDYRVNGALQAATTHAARWITWANPTSYVDGKPTGAGCSSPTSGSGDLGKAPLTLFDCFNSGSLGQVFRPSATGNLTQFRMSMTCLVPSGTAPYDLYALLYELNPEGTTLTGSSPVAATLVNLSNCPTASTWRGKTFRSTDFAMMPMSFGSAQVTAGKFYGIYLTGAGMPGTLPPGASAAMAAAKAATTTTTVPPTTTTTTPWSRFKRESNTAAPTPTPSNTATSTAFTTLQPTVINRSAVRMMTPDQAAKYIGNPLTPKVCLGAGRNLVFIRTGRCTAQIALRRNGRVSTTVTTRVTSGTVVPNDVTVAISEPTIAYFVAGNSVVSGPSRSDIFSLAPAAKNADAVLVTGHSGNLAGEQSNLVTLSSKRAASVRALLRGKGVRKTIAIWGFGASVSVTKEKTERAQNQNRRAEIFLIP